MLLQRVSELKAAGVKSPLKKVSELKAAGKKSPLKKSDYWGDLRGEYEEPTIAEYNIINEYAMKFDFEKDDSVEHEYWKSLSEKLRIPKDQLRPLLLKTLHQIRESKGYDVDSTVGGLFYFVPAKLACKFVTDKAMEASRAAIDTINSQSMKAYLLVSVENFVFSMPHRSYLLTLTVKDGAVADSALKSIRAIVFAPLVAKYQLKEWKFNQS